MANAVMSYFFLFSLLVLKVFILIKNSYRLVLVEGIDIGFKPEDLSKKNRRLLRNDFFPK